MHDVETIDASAAMIMHELLEAYKSRGVSIYMTHLRSGPRETFEKAGIIDLIGEDAIQNDVASAMMKVEMAERGMVGHQREGEGPGGSSGV
jgi:MFS superfamily sulfate permease-like transporter